jgi:hypothetical protein
MHPFSPIGTKESIRGPSASTVSWGLPERLPETARDCQRIARKCYNASKHRDTTTTTTTTPRIPILCALSPTQLSHSLQPNHRRPQQNIKIFIRSLAQHFGIPSVADCSLGSHRLPILGVGWRYVSVSPYRYSTIPCLAGSKLHGYSTVARYA